MSRPGIIILIVLIILVVVGLVLWFSGGSPSYSPAAATSPSGTYGAIPANTSSGTFATSTSAQTSTTVTVTYTDHGFSPTTVTIPKGGTVVFMNAASDAMRVASNPHPTHTGYPTTGGCVGSTFDSCRNIAPGDSWSFQFTYTGRWGYHNHLNPGEGGTVVVQ